MQEISGEGEPNGAVSWDGATKLSMWVTDADSLEVRNEPLYTDTEITHPTDKKFFERMFTDDKYLDQIIKEYEDEFGNSELGIDTLKNMLYYTDGSPIFSKDVTGTGLDADGNAADVDVVGNLAKPLAATSGQQTT